MVEPGWLWRSIGYLFEVTSGRLGPTEWDKILRNQRAVNRRRLRRRDAPAFIALLVVAFCCTALIFWRLQAHFSARVAAEWILAATLVALLLQWLMLRAMRGQLDQTTLEDIAIMEHGKPFAEIDEQQRIDLYRRQTRGEFRREASADEREAELRLRAAAAAYAILRPGLAVVIAAYWAICVFAPLGPQRTALTVTAIAFTWIAAAIIALPTVTRTWSEPDDPEEPKLVAAQKEA
jgi:hypothetical protein